MDSNRIPNEFLVIVNVDHKHPLLVETGHERVLVRVWNRGVSRDPFSNWLHEWLAIDEAIEREVRRSNLPLVDEGVGGQYIGLHATVATGHPHGITLI
jgi:hypothetical protein